MAAVRLPRRSASGGWRSTSARQASSAVAASGSSSSTRATPARSWSVAKRRATTRTSALQGQAIAGAPHGVEVFGEARVHLDVAAQAQDEVVDGARLRLRAHVPDALQELRFRDHAARVQEE